MRWWRLPFSGEPYRRTLFLLLSVPLAVWALADRGAAQRRAAGALLESEPAPTRLRGLAAVPLDLVTLVVAGYCWTGVLLNVAYPIRPLLGMDGEYRDAWGGPTLAGAWAVHALGGVGFWLLVPWILRGYAALWRRFFVVPAG
ncbi:hypothetical protein Daura_01860 [Dactylosporangium aurantiacum]|uniref:Uncharacterized protein n=1 Tax=Dactylosporangium aurantiacum TaxID=35754 RepID=A0A9Q9IKI6_9ACTN|nr:hypothetical protein [Dactylosporangium aurantiacum]MDG6100888.1 hypothetical protein [Dactylosporangium aurantiacum]UWZ55054.1 hypothetical protein Daura_01860 [Dactylosporangium aurantiacum]